MTKFGYAMLKDLLLRFLYFNLCRWLKFSEYVAMIEKYKSQTWGFQIGRFPPKWTSNV